MTFEDHDNSSRNTESESAKTESVRTEGTSAWDYSSHEEFLQYYAKESQSLATIQRFTLICETILRVLSEQQGQEEPLDVVDIGCGAGTQCFLWAERGHRVYGLDVNEPLVLLGKDRAAKRGHPVDFRVGSATELPWPDRSMDVCLLLELLEHVEQWEVCLKQCVRILKPGGILFLTTSNRLCPVQHEFNLPLYSWYPSRAKRYFESLARTDRPQLANHAVYPAVNWFTAYSLRAALGQYGLMTFDRFDLIDTSARGFLARWIVAAIRAIPLLRWGAHVCTSGTTVLARKPGGTGN